MSAHMARELEILNQQVAALERAQSSPNHMVQSMQSGVGYNYMEPPPQQWGHTYHPYDRNHHNLSWTNPNGGTYAPGYLPQPPYQAPRVEPPPQQTPTPRRMSIAELLAADANMSDAPVARMSMAEQLAADGIDYRRPPHQQWGAYAPSYYPQQQQYQAQRPAPPPPQAQQNPAVRDMMAKINEQLDMIVTEMAEMKVRMAENDEMIEAKARRVSMLPDETLPPREQNKAITMDPPSPSHERAEAIEATEEEWSEEVPVPTVDPPSKDTVGRSEENQWPMEQWKAHVTSPLYAEIAHGYHVDTCSMSESDKLIEYVVHEIELLGGEKKAQVLGRRQERKAAMSKKPEGSKSGPRDRYISRHAKMKGSRATSRKIKLSTPRNTTRVKMKASSGVEELKGIDSGQCVPKMAYFKHIDREDLFPSPFIP